MAFSLDKIGVSNLNEVSKELQQNKEKEVLVDIDTIVRNPLNIHSIEDIESLAFSISHTGLQENLVLIKKDGVNMLIAGERRWTALKYIQEHKLPNYKSLKKVRCIYKTLESVDLPLDDEMKEIYLIETTNAEQRNNTEEDILTSVDRLTLIYEELKKNKVQGVPVGTKREYIADKLKVSQSKAGRLLSINSATDEVKEAFESRQLNAKSAEMLAKSEPEVQKSVMKQLNKQAAKQAEEEEETKPLATEDVKTILDKKQEQKEKKDTKKKAKVETVQKVEDEFDEVIGKISELEDVINDIEEATPSQIKAIAKYNKKIDKLIMDIKALF